MSTRIIFYTLSIWAVYKRFYTSPTVAFVLIFLTFAAREIRICLQNKIIKEQDLLINFQSKTIKEQQSIILSQKD